MYNLFIEERKNIMFNKNKNDIPEGVCIGISLGLIFGLLFNNLALGLLFGTSLGLLGDRIKSRKK